MFQVGDRVRCVKTSNMLDVAPDVIEGELYTVAAVFHGFIRPKGMIGWYGPWRFEAVEESKATH